MNRTLSRSCLLLLACLIPIHQLTAQGTDPWYVRQARPQNFNAPMVFRDTFSIELPENWQLAPGFTGTLFFLAEKTRGSQPGALITLQHSQLQAPLDPSGIAVASGYILNDIRSREMAGKQFTSTVATGPAGPLVIIRYERPGFSSRDDQVVQYSFPVGATMYRLICVAPLANIEKYRPIFAHVAASFTPLSSGGS